MKLRETDAQYGDHDTCGRITKTIQWKNGLGDLEDQPRGDNVGGPYSKDVATLEVI